MLLVFYNSNSIFYNSNSIKYHLFQYFQQKNLEFLLPIFHIFHVKFHILQFQIPIGIPGFIKTRPLLRISGPTLTIGVPATQQITTAMPLRKK